MPATLYYVRPGDTLFNIARRYNTSVTAILGANILCNPNLIFPGEVLIIPTPGADSLPRAGGFPYYVVRPGDTLFCIAREFGTTVNILAANNRIPDPNLIFPGQEFLVIGERPDPISLKNQWETLGGWTCEIIPPISIYGIYYRGSYLWEALGPASIPYLIQLLEHPCNIVRIYTIIAFARIAADGQTESALRRTANDPDPAVRQLAPLALRRIALGRQGRREVHLTISPTPLYQEPNMDSPSIILPTGTEVTALRWFIPSPTGEEGPRGGIQIYDRVMVKATNRVGFIPRGGFNETAVV